MANLGNFNANEVDPHKALEPIPAGEYSIAMTASEMKPTATGNGHYLSLEFQVLEGPHKGRKLYDNLNLKNPSPQAVEIARAKLSAICRAVGCMTPKDSTELHNKPLIGIVGHKKREDTGEMQNSIKGYKARGAGSTRPATPGAPPRTPPPARAGAPAASTNRAAPFRRPQTPAEPASPVGQGQGDPEPAEATQS